MSIDILFEQLANSRSKRMRINHNVRPPCLGAGALAWNAFLVCLCLALASSGLAGETFVQQHGPLRVNGNRIVDKHSGAARKIRAVAVSPVFQPAKRPNDTRVGSMGAPTNYESPAGWKAGAA